MPKAFSLQITKITLQIGILQGETGSAGLRRQPVIFTKSVNV
jgi:hypothetical protein